MGTPVRVDVWSDVACPFCWLGKRHLDLAIERLGLTGDVAIDYRSFELSPGLTGARPVREYLAEKTGDPTYADRAHARLVAAGEAVGLRYDFDRAIASSTFDAHRLHHFARTRGLGTAMMDRLLAARQSEGADVSDHATLVRLAGDVGLAAEDARAMLGSDQFAREVRADEAEAASYGIRGVPFFVLGGRYAVSGAQPVELFVEALETARGAVAP